MFIKNATWLNLYSFFVIFELNENAREKVGIYFNTKSLPLNLFPMLAVGIYIADGCYKAKTELSSFQKSHF